MKVTCPVCLGSGHNPKYDIKPLAPAQCQYCSGTGEVEGTELNQFNSEV